MRSRTNNIRQNQNHKAQSDVLTLPQGDSNSWNNSVAFRALLLQRNILIVICIILSVMLLQPYRESLSILSGSALPSWSSKSSKVGGKSLCQISLGEYQGPVYRSIASGTLGEPQCLLDSKWMRVSLHSVKFPGSNTTYDDWMWIDYHDRINVLVEDEKRPEEGKEPQFLVFEQTKYALEGRNSLAIIGGIIEVGEDPISAARREVHEEMNGLICEEFHSLGRFRTDVNRGLGWLNGFLATKCTRDSKILKPKAMESEVGVSDVEKQNLKSITLTELRQAVIQGKFIEVQWTATVAQAIVKFYS